MNYKDEAKASRAEKLKRYANGGSAVTTPPRDRDEAFVIDVPLPNDKNTFDVDAPDKPEFEDI